MEVLEEVADEYWKAQEAELSPPKGPSLQILVDCPQICSVLDEDSNEE